MSPDPDSDKFKMLIGDTTTEGCPRHMNAVFNKINQRLGVEGPLVFRADGDPVPPHRALFNVGENVVVGNCTFRIGYINDATMVLEPVGIVEIGVGKNRGR